MIGHVELRMAEQPDDIARLEVLHEVHILVAVASLASSRLIAPLFQ